MYVQPSVLSSYISQFAVDVSYAYPSVHPLVPASITKYVGHSDGLLQETDGLLEETFSTRSDIPFCIFTILCSGRVSIDEGAIEHPMTVKSKMAMANTFFIFP